ATIYIRVKDTSQAEPPIYIAVSDGTEDHPIPYPHHDDPDRHALNPPRRQLGLDLLPKDGGDLVAVEPVEDPAGFLGGDQTLVELSRVGKRLLDGGSSALVEHHPLHRHLQIG